MTWKTWEFRIIAAPIYWRNEAHCLNRQGGLNSVKTSRIFFLFASHSLFRKVNSVCQYIGAVIAEMVIIVKVIAYYFCGKGNLVFTGKRQAQIEKNPQSPRSQATGQQLSHFSLLSTLYSLKSTSFFKEQSCKSNVYFYIWYLPGTNLQCTSREILREPESRIRTINNEELVHVKKLEVSYNLKKS